VLAENAGRVVPKEELIATVWPKVFVEESNLKIQVSALCRALGDGQTGNRFIVTVPGRGYEFVVPVSRTAEPAAMPAPAAPQPGTHNLPFAMTRMIGREEAVATLASRLPRERVLTIVGPGGIGKTTVALVVAERMISESGKSRERDQEIARNVQQASAATGEVSVNTAGVTQTTDDTGCSLWPGVQRHHRIVDPRATEVEASPNNRRLLDRPCRSQSRRQGRLRA
jgi:hypothetical protein